MKNVFLFLLICAVVPNFLYADCVLESVDNVRDQYIFPSVIDYERKYAFVCGKGHCENGTVIGIKSPGGKFYTGSGFLGKPTVYTQQDDELYVFSCRTGSDDMWTIANTSVTRFCGLVEEDFFDNYEMIGKKDSRAVFGKRIDLSNGYTDLCYIQTCQNEGEKYRAIGSEEKIYELTCINNIYVQTDYDNFPWYNCYERSMPDFDKEEPEGFSLQYYFDGTFGVYVANGSGRFVKDLGVTLYDAHARYDRTKMCYICADGFFSYRYGCYSDVQMAWCEWYIDNGGNANWDYRTDECKCKRTGYTWDSEKHECSKNGKKDTTVNDSQNTSTQPQTARKTVEERCQEYNGGQPCSAERLACYKKGSATKWQDGKCQCVDTNRTWKYENNDGQCVENKAVTVNNNNNTLCKTALGDLEIGKSFTGVDLENCKDTEKTETNTDAVASWEIICETEAKVICKPYTCTDGYELNSEIGGCVVKKIQKPETDPVNDTKKKEIENAKRVVRDFFASAERNANVWRDKDGKFNTARLASDVTAGVILGTVGGVVSSVVIKKKQVEKGFDALHCTVGGQAVADWGDTFRVGIAK